MGLSQNRLGIRRCRSKLCLHRREGLLRDRAQLIEHVQAVVQGRREELSRKLEER